MKAQPHWQVNLKNSLIIKTFINKAYQSHHDDDLCVYSNKCLAPSLTQWTTLSHENLESELLKCMIQVRIDRKNKNSTLRTIENSDQDGLAQIPPKNQTISFKIEIDNTGILYMTSGLILMFLINILKKRFFKKQNLQDNNVQVSGHSLDKSTESSMDKKEDILIIENPIKNLDNVNRNIEIKSLLNFDKNNVLGYGANGTVVYNGFFQEREVAIKRILKHNSSLGKIEIDILIKLDHPNIIKFFYYEEKE